jgi:hypothetical protein
MGWDVKCTWNSLPAVELKRSSLSSCPWLWLAPFKYSVMFPLVFWPGPGPHLGCQMADPCKKKKISFISRLNPIISFEMYLEKHFLPIAERIAAFRTTGTGRMKVMVISGLHFFQNMSVDVKGLFRLWWLSQDAWLKKLRCYLKDFAGDKALAVVAFDAKLTLIIFLAVRESIPGWYQTKNTFVTKGPSERNHSSY